MQNIGKISLRNEGSFDVAMEIVYWTDVIPKTQVPATDSYPVGELKTVDPGDLGVPNNSYVSLYVDVDSGEDNASGDEYLYTPDLDVIASYVICGSAEENYLGLLHVG